MSTLLTSSESHAQEANVLFVYRDRCELGSLAAPLGGLYAPYSLSESVII